ncbi:TRAP transporter substrate-binding protein [Lentibacillus salinarum]|uniref:TRAP transporter substrate-binding protein n=1 Tax=Lentibacillus salinarum TaxID=446820 RepID=A0ABW3ZRZ8_9BACI
MKKIIGIKTVLIFMSLLLVLAGCGGEQESVSGEDSNSKEVIELQLGHIATETNPYHLLAEEFKELVEERSNGRLKINIFPNAQLGEERELLEAMTFGNLDLAVITTSPVTNFVPEFGVLDIPYLFEDWDQANTFVESNIADKLLKETEEVGIKTYGFVPRGFRSVTTSNHPVENPEDMDGLKIRVIESEVYLDTINEMGATATAMPWGDAYTAMQQGAIDGQENDYSIIYTQNVPEVQKYLSLTEHIFAVNTLMGSTSNIEQLPEDLQKIIEESAVEATESMGEHNLAEADNLRQKIEEEGMEINEVDKDSFIEAVSDTQEKYSEQYGSTYFQDIKALFD